MVAINADYDLLIAGTGMAGMALAIQTSMKLPHVRIGMLEKESRVGGTWHLNTYPGAGCDVPSHFYSLSFAPNPNWSRLMSAQAEINEYQQDVAKKFQLDRYIQFETAVTGAEWDDTKKLWTVRVNDERTGKSYDITTVAFVPALGTLHIPNDCNIKGAKNFKGPIFHSARWDHSVETKDKNVIVVGNGCSATQFVPILVKEAKQVRQFVRSMHYLIDQPNVAYTEKEKKRFAKYPKLRLLYRGIIAAFLDFTFTAFFAKGIGRYLRKIYQKSVVAYMKKNCPPKYHKVIIPDFEIGCKRRVIDTGYLKCLHEENMDVTQDALVEIKENSVLTKSGEEYPADVICLANGFKVGKFIVSITGRAGETLDDHWDRMGGPQAYFSTCVSDFPNMFISMGPNSVTGHYSYLFTSECQNNFIISLLERIIPSERTDISHGVIEVSRAAEAADAAWIEEATDKTIVGKNGGCTSWYATAGKNTALYPHYQTHFRLRSEYIRWQDFLLNGQKPGTRLGAWVYSTSKSLLPIVGASLLGIALF